MSRRLLRRATANEKARNAVRGKPGGRVVLCRRSFSNPEHCFVAPVHYKQCTPVDTGNSVLWQRFNTTRKSRALPGAGPWKKTWWERFPFLFVAKPGSETRLARQGIPPGQRSCSVRPPHPSPPAVTALSCSVNHRTASRVL